MNLSRRNPGLLPPVTTHTGFNPETHETIPGVGMEAHLPHKHGREEIILLMEGTAEFHIQDRTDTVEAGSVVYFDAHEMHNSSRPRCAIWRRLRPRLHLP